MTNTALRRRLAATIITGLPDVPGRKRLARKVFGPRTGVTQATFGPGLTFTLDLTDYDQSSAWYFQFDQPALAPLLDCVLRPGDVMVDVGANIGTYTCWAARTVGASGQVHAFEPVPGTRTVLSAHVDQNALSNVTVHPVAVGDTPGELTLFTVPGISGWSATYPRDEGSVPVTMPVVTLDDQFPGKVPRLVKIDVEGFEPQVLRGMTRLMNGDTPPIIALELCDVLLRPDQGYRL